MKQAAEELVQKVARVYGEECKSQFVALAKGAEPDADLQDLLDQAVEKTYNGQVNAAGATMRALHFNSK